MTKELNMKKILIIIICILSFAVLMYSENTEKVIPLVQSETLEYFYNQNNDVLTSFMGRLPDFKR